MMVARSNCGRRAYNLKSKRCCNHCLRLVDQRAHGREASSQANQRDKLPPLTLPQTPPSFTTDYRSKRALQTQLPDLVAVWHARTHAYSGRHRVRSAPSVTDEKRNYLMLRHLTTTSTNVLTS